MAGQINSLRPIAEAAGEDPRNRVAVRDGTGRSAENPERGFNRHIYQNLVVHIEGQIEAWNRKAVREPNPEAAHALWLKAEGLGYALRLLYAFEPELRELVECASQRDRGRFGRSQAENKGAG